MFLMSMSFSLVRIRALFNSIAQKYEIKKVFARYVGVLKAFPFYANFKIICYENLEHACSFLNICFSKKILWETNLQFEDIRFN